MKQTLRKVLTRKSVVFSLAALLLYMLVGFVALPLLIRWYVPKYAEEYLHCRAGVEAIRINPLLFSVEIEKFRLEQSDGAPLVAFDRFLVDLETSSLFRWAIVLRTLELDQPDIHLAIEPDGSLNFANLVPPSSEPTEPTPPDSEPLPVIFQNTAIRGGQVALSDKRQSAPAVFALQGIDLQLTNVSTVRDRLGTCRLAASTAAGESFLWEGEATLFPFHSSGTLSLNALRIASLWQFARDSTNLEEPAGHIDFSTQYRVGTGSDQVQLTLEGLHYAITDLALKLHNTDKPLFQLKKFDLEVPSFDLATKTVHVGRLLLEEGAADARINDAGGINFQQIVRASPPQQTSAKETPPPEAPPATPPSTPEGTTESAPAPAAPQPAADTPFKVQVDAIGIKNLAVDLNDQSRKAPIEAAIAGIDLHLKANLEVGAGKNSVVLSEIASEVRGIKVRSPQPQEPLFAAEKLTVEGGTCDLSAQKATVERIALSKGRLDVGLDAEGAINWLQLLQTKGAADSAPEAKPASKAAPSWQFLVKSFEIDGFGSQFTDLTTSSNKPVLSVRDCKVRLTEIDGTSPMGFTVGLQVEQGGSATVSGTVNPALPSVEAEIKVSDLVLTSLQPYLEPHVTLQLQSAAVAAQGRLRYGLPGDASQIAYEGSFSLNNLRLADAKTPKKPLLGWDAVLLPKFKLTVQPNNLDAQEIKIVKPIGEFIIEEDQTLNLVKVLKNRPDDSKPAASTKPAAGKAKAAPTKTTASKAAPKKEQPQKAQAQKAAPSKEEDAFPYRIAKVRVEEGNVVFADLGLRPQFKTRIHGLKGTVVGLSSAKDAQAQVQLDGRVDQYGTAKINGIARPNDFGRASDIEMVFRNLEMKNISPYSGKFAGRMIKSGKFSADLKYVLKDYKMTGDNKIVIDNLTLGEQVDSPESANLPLDLAIALLKDANGRIDIGLPVAGDLNDPEFSIGPLIWHVFTNLITKAVTSPFRALGGLLGDDSANFDAVAFDPGDTEPPPPEKEKLLKLADALNSRPQLKLVIQGRFSPEADGLALKERSIRKTVAVRLGAKPGPGDSAEPLDFTDSGTRKILEQLYAERFGKDALDELEQGVETGKVTPRPPPQQEKTKEAGMFARMVEGIQLYKIIPGGMSREQGMLWASELYNRLVESEKIADQSLLDLAEKRAQSLAAFLENEVKIPKNRMSVKAAEPFTGDEPPAVSLSLDAL